MTWFDGDSDAWPRLLRFLALHALFGTVAGAFFAIFLIVMNVEGLADLLMQGDRAVIGAAMLIGAFGLTFGAAAMGTAVMLLPRR
jgi:hypothetical protein